MKYVRMNLKTIQEEMMGDVKLDLVMTLGFIRIRGEEDVVAKAVEKLESIKLNLVEYAFNVNRSIVGAIVGKNGTTIGKIQKESQTALDVNREAYIIDRK